MSVMKVVQPDSPISPTLPLSAVAKVSATAASSPSPSPPLPSFPSPLDDTRVVTRWLLLRSTAGLYLIAFFVALNQGPALIGSNGLYPYPRYLARLRQHYASQNKIAWLEVPTLFFFVPREYTDLALISTSALGVLLSLSALLGYANVVSMGLMWALFMSITNVGQLFWGYGWEMQLLETGFLSLWLVSVFSFTPPPAESSSQRVVIWLYRWLIIRIMWGAGLIKIRGDDCWRDLTCLIHHYETQPIPNPLSFYLHYLPDYVHMAGVLVNHIVELLVPFLLLLPLPLLSAERPLITWSLRPARIVGGVLFVAFQGMLIISGNLSYLNYLTVVPALACFDDAFLSWVSSFFLSIWRKERQLTLSRPLPPSRLPSLRLMLTILFALLVAYLSASVVQNLAGERQVMNASFDRLKLVNTYGAFGSVGKVRNEVILEGTYDSLITGSTNWIEYEFKCKPGAVDRRPCIIAPYHLRLDWQIWFAAMQSADHNPWLVTLIAKLLRADPAALGLLGSNPEFEVSPPKFIKASLYEYNFAPFNSTEAWWVRRYVRSYLPALSLDHEGLQRFLQQNEY